MIYLPDVDNIYLGSSGVTKIMLGDVQVWPTVPFEEQYLTIEPVSSGYFWFKRFNGLSPLVTIEYSLNGGAWTTYTEEVPISAGDKVRLRGNNSTYGGSNPLAMGEDETDNTSHIIGTKNLENSFDDCNYKMYGNVMSLVYGDNFVSANTLTESYAFANLFNRRTVNQGFCIEASHLVLPATTLTTGCYYNMFDEQHFGTAPKLEADSVPIYAYQGMFQDCRYLRQVYCTATNLAYKATFNWFKYAEAGEGGCVFYKHPNMTWERSIDGVPSWMTIEDAQI